MTTKILSILIISLLSSPVWAGKVMYSKLPDSVNELVQSSDMIVIGNITDVIDNRVFHGYQVQSVEAKSKKQPVYTSPIGHRIVDLNINVVEILKPDFKMKSWQGVTLRLFETVTDEDEFISNNSGKRVFFLSRTPDGKAYGLLSLGHQVELDNGIPTFSISGKKYKTFEKKSEDSKLNAEEFIERVKEEIYFSDQTGLEDYSM